MTILHDEGTINIGVGTAIIATVIIDGQVQIHQSCCGKYCVIKCKYKYIFIFNNIIPVAP